MEDYRALAVRHSEVVAQLFEAFTEDQIDFTMEMEAYETERVKAEKKHLIVNAPETIPLPKSEFDTQSSHVLLEEESACPILFCS